MVRDHPLNNKFNWGEAVIVKATAPKKFGPLKRGSVCGIRNVDPIDLAKALKAEIKNILYLIEFANGSAIEIPEKYLSKFK